MGADQQRQQDADDEARARSQPRRPREGARAGGAGLPVQLLRAAAVELPLQQVEDLGVGLRVPDAPAVALPPGQQAADGPGSQRNANDPG